MTPHTYRIGVLGGGALGNREIEARQFWEHSPLSATEIGLRFNVSKNVIIGIAHRRGWVSFNPPSPPHPYRTTLDRLDALNANLDRLLAETEWRPEYGLGCPAVRL